MRPGLLVAAAGFAGAPASAQKPPPPCCDITSIDMAAGLVSARVTASGNVFQFKVSDARTLGTLKVGQGIYANFGGKQVSLDGRSACCSITSGPTAPTAPAPAPAPAPPPVSAASSTVLTTAVTATLIESVSLSIVRVGMAPVLIGSRASFAGGQEVTITVTLKSVASETVGLTVTTSNPSLVQAPVAVAVSANSREERFHVLTRPVSVATPVSLTLTRRPGDAKTVEFTIIPPSLTRLELSKTAVMGGDSLVAKVHFSGPPPGTPPVQVQFVSSDQTVVPALGYLTLPPDRTVVERILASRGQAEPKQVTITASYAGQTFSGQLSVAPAEIAAWTHNPYILNSALIEVGVSLTGAAPVGGAVVQLSSSDPQAYPVPATVTVAAGNRYNALRVDVPPTTTSGTGLITATYRGKQQSVAIGVVYDLTLSALAFTDRFNNPITKPLDAQPFNVCVRVNRGGNGTGPTSVPVEVTYATSTGTGRTLQIQAVFAHPLHWDAPACTALPGLEPGQSHQVTFNADPRSQIGEGREDNNTVKGSIAR